MPDVRMSRGMSALRTAWSLAGVCLLSLLVVEGCGRLLYWCKDTIALRAEPTSAAQGWPAARIESIRETRLLHLHWEPYVYFRYSPSHGRCITIERDGCRRTWRPPRQPSPGTRGSVALFGGSAMWGFGARDDYTIPSFLARRLAADGSPLQVVNRAQPGWVSTQSLLDLLLELRAERVPSVVVFYDGVNDEFASLQRGTAGVPQNERNREAEFNLLQDQWRLRHAALGGTPVTALGRLAAAVRHRIWREPPEPPRKARNLLEDSGTSDEQLDSLALKVVRAYEHNVKVVCALADAYGFRPLFYWQPNLLMKKALTEKDRRDLETGVLPREMQDRLQRFCWAVHRHLESSSFLRQNRAFHNLGLVFADDRREIFFDWSHVSEEANGLLADEIYRDIRTLLGTRDSHARSAVTGGSPHVPAKAEDRVPVPHGRARQ